MDFTALAVSCVCYHRVLFVWQENFCSRIKRKEVIWVPPISYLTESPTKSYTSSWSHSGGKIYFHFLKSTVDWETFYHFIRNTWYSFSNVEIDAESLANLLSCSLNSEKLGLDAAILFNEYYCLASLWLINEART